MTYYVETEYIEPNYVVTVEHDEHASNPRKEWDNIGTVVLGDRVRYDFGDESMSVEGIQEIINDPDNIVLPVYMYDHSGITINTTGFSCRWDRGQVGIIYMSKADAVKNWGKKICTAKVREKAIACLRAEIKELDNYLTGSVYGFRVYQIDLESLDEGDTLQDITKDFDDYGTEVDSCWGYYGDSEYCLSVGVDSAKWHVEDDAKKAAAAAELAALELNEATYWAQRDVPTTTGHAAN